MIESFVEHIHIYNICTFSYCTVLVQADLDEVNVQFVPVCGTELYLYDVLIIGWQLLYVTVVQCTSSTILLKYSTGVHHTVDLDEEFTYPFLT